MIRLCSDLFQKSFVTAEVIFNTINEQISNETLQNVYSVMTDTTAFSILEKNPE